MKTAGFEIHSCASAHLHHYMTEVREYKTFPRSQISLNRSERAESGIQVEELDSGSEFGTAPPPVSASGVEFVSGQHDAGDRNSQRLRFGKDLQLVLNRARGRTLRRRIAHVAVE